MVETLCYLALLAADVDVIVDVVDMPMIAPAEAFVS